MLHRLVVNIMQDKKCNKCGETKTIDMFSIKKASKDGRMSICKVCDAVKARKWHADNQERSRARAKKYREENREHVLQRDRDRYYNDKENILKQREEHYENNREVIIERVGKYQRENREVNRKARKKHYQKNKTDYMAISATRRASKLQATPIWLNEIHKMQIQWFYSASKMMTETSGVKHHVDHIHPLQGDGFAGLHVPCNLRVIKAEENISKNNKLPQELKNLAWEKA